MRQNLLLVTVFLFGSFFASAQDDLEDKNNDSGNEKNENAAYNVGAVKVKDNIYMLKGRGGNIGVQIGEDGIFMIDDQFAESSPYIMQTIRTLSDKPIELLVNTHHHGDHIGGNSKMAELGTIIFSHVSARRRMTMPYMQEAKESYKREMDSLLSRYGSKTSMSEENKRTAQVEVDEILGPVEDRLNVPEGILPVVSFPGDLTLNYNGEKILVMHVPNAHTDGDVMIYFTKNNVLHTGDAFFNGTYPFIDTDNGGRLSGYMAGLQKIIKMVNEDTKIIPGHGNVASIDDLKYTERMFQFLSDRIAYYILDNKTEAEVIAMGLTKEYDDRGFGDGFITTDQFVGIMYKELAKKHSTN
jgi:glyoxylase-like metal-dependent hydrolase (beta-lactamase superfamily II)